MSDAHRAVLSITKFTLSVLIATFVCVLQACTAVSPVSQTHTTCYAAVPVVRSSHSAIILLCDRGRDKGIHRLDLSDDDKVASLAMDEKFLYYAVYTRRDVTSDLYRCEYGAGLGKPVRLEQGIPGSVSAVAVIDGKIWYASERVVGSIGGEKTKNPSGTRPVCLVVGKSNVVLISWFDVSEVGDHTPSRVFPKSVHNMKVIGNGCAGSISNCDALPQCSGALFFVNGEARCEPIPHSPKMSYEIDEPYRQTVIYINGMKYETGPWSPAGGEQWAYFKR